MTPPRSPTLFRLKSWAIMVNDRLFPAILRVRRSTAGCPAAIAPSAARIGARGGAPSRVGSAEGSGVMQCSKTVLYSNTPLARRRIAVGCLILIALAVFRLSQ